MSLCVFNFVVYVPLLARTVLHLGPEGFGFLMAALGVGAVAGALALGARQPRAATRSLARGGAVACAGLVGLSAVHHVWTAVALLLVTGFTGIVTVTGCNTALQLTARRAPRPDHEPLHLGLRRRVPHRLLPRGRDLGAPWRVGAFLVTGTLGLSLLGLLAVTRPWREPAGDGGPDGTRASGAA